MNNINADIGLIGLGVMGSSLALNMESNGYTVAVHNRTSPQIDNIVKNRSKFNKIFGFESLEKFVDSIKTPRKIMLMVVAGSVVDDYIQKLIPLLDQGDIIIDGGNSHYPDTSRRTEELESEGFQFIGAGVSGGEEGALKGPSIMPGGSVSAWPEVKEIFQKISAKVGDNEPCCDWIGEGGSGHFVKMVHNGIEYGIMQAYAEGFNILHEANAGAKYVKAGDAEVAPMDNPADYQYDINVAEVAELWRRGSVVGSWLLDLTADVLRGDRELKRFSGGVSDSGEGRWTVHAAVDLGVPAPVISTALYERFNSRSLGAFASKVLNGMRFMFGGHHVR